MKRPTPDFGEHRNRSPRDPDQCLPVVNLLGTSETALMVTIAPLSEPDVVLARPVSQLDREVTFAGEVGEILNTRICATRNIIRRAPDPPCASRVTPTS